MAYTQTTWGELKSRLLSRLGEESFYPAAIREQGLNEALQVWQSLVGEWMSGFKALSSSDGLYFLATTNVFPLRVIVPAGAVELPESTLTEMDSSTGVAFTNAAAAATTHSSQGVSFILFDKHPGAVAIYDAYFVTNPPQFALDATVLQMQESEMDAVIEYAAHVCMFSEGGDEFTASSTALTKMVTLALKRNSRLSSLAPYRKYMGTDKELREKSREIPTESGGR
jgi:hypothetical protein